MRRFLLTLLLALSITGCPAMWAALPRVAQGAAWLGSLLDVAAAGTDAYYARHPNQAAEANAASMLRRAREALALLHETLADAEIPDDPMLAEARARVLEAYRVLRSTLAAAGVLDARAPEGGAEGDAPAPEPVDLPAAEAVAARLEL